MTKVRDIAAFLGKTEAFNTTNKRLAFDSNEISTLTPTIASDIINQYATVVYNTVDSLPANPTDGSRAWVKANNRFYVADSSWHNTLLVNVPPTINITNYDSVLTDSQSLTMTIQVTDSFENLDIITFGATLSPSNITDSAVLSFSRDSSVIALAINPDSATSNARSFSITFSANDQINLATSVKSFTIDRGYVLTLISQVDTVSGGTIINIDSDVAGGEFQLTSGDVLSLADGSLDAVVSSATFLDNTEQSRTSAGTTTGYNAGTGKVRIPAGVIGSGYIGWVWSSSSSNTTAASRFRTGNASGGQIISGVSLVEGFIANTYGLSSMYVHGAVNGAFYRSYEGTVCTQYSLTTNGGITRKGTLPITALGTNQTWSPYASGQKAGVDHKITMKVDPLTSGNQGVNYVWPIPSYTSNWTYRNVNIRAASGGFGSGTTMQSRIVLDGDQRANFPVDGKIYVGEATPIGSPTAQEVYEGKHFTIVATVYWPSGYSGTGFYITTSTANANIGVCANGNSVYYNCKAAAGQTGIVLAGAMGYTQTTVWGSALSTGLNANSFNQNVPMYVRDPSYCNQVYIISPDYPGTRFTQAGQDFWPSYSEWSSTNNASGVANGTSTYPIYLEQSGSVTELTMTPSPAGNGTNVNIGTSTVASYVWKNGTKVVVDDNTGFSASDDIYLKE